MRLTFPHILRSEWTKLRTLRSTWFVLGIAAVLTVTVAGVISWAAIDIISFVIGIMGIMGMTGEHSATFMAVPKRIPVLAAKALALIAVTAPLMLIVCAASFEVSQMFSHTRNDLVVRALLGAAAAPVAVALLGLGIGTAIRHTAGAIATFVAAMLIVPALLPAALPASVRDDVLQFSPVAAAQAMYAMNTTDNPFHMLSPGKAAIVTVGWVIAVLALGAVLLQRRDA
jgi:ABC-2 type transport system permease protein